ncbi:MAG: ABC transporter substrate-binding protein [Bacillota bacterium]|jgi:branched-chain amino acid transport system substrate-binding protein|nr:ABC transporter substrate-binding protein [Candidatus Fermentithermobacillaceae bacterium]
MRNKRTMILLAVLLVAAFVFAGCGDKEAGGEEEVTEDVIRIGVYEPMTGDSAAGGQMTWEGIQLANELYPEVLGKQVRLFLEDNKTDKVEAANAVNRLIEHHKVVAIIGSYGSSMSMAGGPVAQEKGIPVVGCSPTNPLVTLGNDYYFRVCFIDPFQGRVMAQYAFESLGAETAVIIRNVADDYAVGLGNYFQEAFVEFTGSEDSILSVLDYQKGDQDFTAQLTTVKNLNPDVVFAPGSYGDSALMIRQARELGIQQPFLGGDTWEAPEFIEVGGEAVEGAVLSTHYSPEATPTAISEEFVQVYKEKFGKEANAFAALGFDAYMVILDAIERAGSAEPQAIRDALAATENFQGVTGIITLDENGDATKSAVILKVDNGEFRYLTTVNP